MPRSTVAEALLLALPRIATPTLEESDDLIAAHDAFASVLHRQKIVDTLCASR